MRTVRVRHSCRAFKDVRIDELRAMQFTVGRPLPGRIVDWSARYFVPVDLLACRQAVEHAILTGRGNADLLLTAEQYAKLAKQV
jgi:hypothetical protein